MMKQIISTQISNNQTCRLDDKLIIAFRQYIQIYRIQNDLVVPQYYLAAPSEPTFISSCNQILFVVCKKEMLIADLSNSQPELVSSGFMVGNAISITSLKSLIAVATPQHVTLFNMQSGKQIFQTPDREGIQKVITFEDNIVFITHDQICKIDLAALQVFEFQPHLYKQIKDKTNDLLFRYIDVAFDEYLYLINTDGKTIFLNNEFQTRRWQNITENRYQALGCCCYDQYQAIWFEKGVIKFNQKEFLTYYGKVDLQKELQSASCNIVMCFGKDAFLYTLLQNGQLLQIQPQFVEIDGKFRIASTAIRVLIQGQNSDVLTSQSMLIFTQTQRLYMQKDKIIQNLQDFPQFDIKCLNDGKLFGLIFDQEGGKSTLNIVDFGSTDKARNIQCKLTERMNKIMTTSSADAIRVLIVNKRGLVLYGDVRTTEQKELNLNSYDLKCQIQDTFFIDPEKIMILDKDRYLIFNILNGQKTTFIKFNEQQQLLGSFYEKKTKLFIISFVQRVGVTSTQLFQVQIFIYSINSNVPIVKSVIFENTQICFIPDTLNLTVLAVNDGSPLVVLSLSDELRFYSLIDMQLQYKIPLKLGLQQELSYFLQDNELEIISDQFQLLVDISSLRNNILDDIQSSIDKFGESAKQSHLVFNDTEFDVSTHEQLSISDSEQQHNPFARSDALKDSRQGKMIELSSRSSSKNKFNESSSTSDVSEMVKEAVQKSQHQSITEYHAADEYIVYDDDQLVVPIFGFRILGTVEICTDSQQQPKTISEDNVLKNLLDSSSEEKQEERKQQVVDEFSPAQLLLRQINNEEIPEVKQLSTDEQNQIVSQYTEQSSQNVNVSTNVIEGEQASKLIIQVVNQSHANEDQSRNHDLDAQHKGQQQENQQSETQDSLKEKESQPASNLKRSQQRANSNDEELAQQSQQLSHDRVCNATLQNNLQSILSENSLQEAKASLRAASLSAGATPRNHSAVRPSKPALQISVPQSQHEVSIPTQSEAANSATIELQRALSNVQKELNQSITQLEINPELSFEISGRQKQAVKMQVRLLQNTINRINVLYGFEDELTIKVDELTQLVGRTLGGDLLSPSQSKGKQSKVKDFI